MKSIYDQMKVIEKDYGIIEFYNEVSFYDGTSKAKVEFEKGKSFLVKADKYGNIIKEIELTKDDLTLFKKDRFKFWNKV